MIPDATWLTALTGLITALCAGVVLVIRELRSNGRELKQNTQLTLHSNELSNQRHDNAMARIDQLGKAMQAAGIPIPDDPGIVQQNSRKDE